MNALVTGGGGFLGRYLVQQLLERGYSVQILGRRPQLDLQEQGVDCFIGDIAHSEVVEAAADECDVIFHVAAKAGVWGSWQSFYDANVIGTQNVLNACKKHAIRYLVHTSTPSVVFTGNPFRGADESLPYGANWQCHYAHTKAIAEKTVLEAHDPKRLRTIALRPHLIWGVGDNHIILALIQKAKSGRLKRVGEGENFVDITHVKNAAQAHILALDALIEKPSKSGGRGYFIAQEEPVNLWKWVDQLLVGLGLPAVKKSVSYRKAYKVGAVLEKIYKWAPFLGEPPMTRFVATELAKDHYFDISAAKNVLGYKPVISTEEGLKELFDVLKEVV